MDSYTREPDENGVVGRAWKMKRPEGGPPDWQLNVTTWIVNRPGAHPFWSYWMVAVISLEPMPGVRPAHKQYPEATHEFIILSLDPKKPLPEIDGRLEGCRAYPLMPPDAVVQFHGLENDKVEELALLAVKAIVNGQLSPDQDYRKLWHTAVQQTVHHLKNGHHEEHDDGVN